VGSLVYCYKSEKNSVYHCEGRTEMSGFESFSTVLKLWGQDLQRLLFPAVALKFQDWTLMDCTMTDGFCPLRVGQRWSVSDRNIYSHPTSAQTNLAKVRIAVLPSLAATNAFVRCVLCTGTFFPLKSSTSRGGQRTPYLIHGFLDPRKSELRTESRSV